MGSNFGDAILLVWINLYIFATKHQSQLRVAIVYVIPENISIVYAGR